MKIKNVKDFPSNEQLAHSIKLNYTHNPERLVTAVINSDFNCGCATGRNEKKRESCIVDTFSYTLKEYELKVSCTLSSNVFQHP